MRCIIVQYTPHITSAVGIVLGKIKIRNGKITAKQIAKKGFYHSRSTLLTIKQLSETSLAEMEQALALRLH